MGEKQKKIGIDAANCTALSIHAPVEMLKNTPNDSLVTGFSIKAYTGEVVDRWWGQLAIDLSGLSAKQQIPIFLNHDPDQIVGYSKSTRSGEAFFVDGVFSSATDEAKRAKALANEGFPWQASIGVRAKSILKIEEGVSTPVNGREVTGPAEVWMESEVFETSFVPVGADSNTSIATFSSFEENEIPDFRQYEIDHRDTAPSGAELSLHNHRKDVVMEKITIEVLKEQAPDLLAGIESAAAEKARKEGLKEGLKQGAEIERKRIEEVMSQDMPGHEALIQKLAFDGTTTGPEAAVQILAAERQIRKVTKDNLAADAIDPVSSPSAPDTPTAPKTVTAENFSQHKNLVEEFGSFEIYDAYQTAADQGLARIVGGK